MARIELNYVDGLVFQEDEHRYFLNGKELIWRDSGHYQATVPALYGWHTQAYPEC